MLYVIQISYTGARLLIPGWQYKPGQDNITDYFFFIGPLRQFDWKKFIEMINITPIIVKQYVL